MDYEKLIEFLVDEIYKKIQAEDKKSNYLEKKKSIVVMGESDVDFYKKALKEFDINPLTSECKDCDILLISKLCIKGLSNISQGTCTTKSEKFALEMLLKGKKVYILEDGIEYRKYKNTAPKVLYNKYIKFEENLLSYGIEIINDLNKISIESKEQKISFNGIKEEKDLESSIVADEITINLSNKKLVSESDLRKPHINGVKTLILDKKAILTPLAKDYIRINNLNVVLS
ncbi:MULTISPECIES: TIGR02536 family ethanolamine utilization protein [Clostridium]|uniref:Ethanolamine utilization protein n=1 Tax=Clostridium cadaveris TaxID=1529 RepID=A0A1I2JUQ3_9CLOT|nr:TIGR02536 family ethanolamine utilization protein [Clostridium cadaveris]MDU4952167.1 TIGR02536 family ethanolamine utilization protein [Clostridium sp.]MDM8310461.1 TIGR02536 family ethanolamine utilization protein [Clostridium cadaveris]MDY4950740.1 TIGR02536 family ethanolamine utilization protein [Clostridium cadaveris]NME64622.1 ethanolamine utilization protein [Clostridium cadaveris]NWK10719.1 ethanolamine utilization protein [Clostridium cadaveris]